jgi:hypothetical protein
MNFNIPPLITPRTAKKILRGEDKISLDLGKTKTEIEIKREEVILSDKFSITFEDLRKISNRDNIVFFVEESGVFSVAISGRHFYKLVPTEGAPTIEIDGIRMHRSKYVKPERDTESKLEVLDLNYGRVLDTCTGLGYTATHSLERGAEFVITIELDVNVLKIAKMNPWSKTLFTSSYIHKLLGDSYFLINTFPPNFFDYIIHDPPRFSLAGELYSGQFYAFLYRILKARGKLFHYTGEPGSRYRKINIRRGVIQRLRRAGFKSLKYYPDALGVTAEKY